MTTEEKAGLARLQHENDHLRREFRRRGGNVLESLRTLPEDEALHLFRRFRAMNYDSNAVSRPLPERCTDTPSLPSRVDLGKAGRPEQEAGLSNQLDSCVLDRAHLQGYPTRSTDKPGVRAYDSTPHLVLGCLSWPFGPIDRPSHQSIFPASRARTQLDKRHHRRSVCSFHRLLLI